MDEARWRKVEALYEAALAVAPSQRAALLEESCGGDASLRSEVESLLSCASKAQDFLEAPAVDILPDATRQAVGQRVAHYEIEEKLGEGGMGVVYKARDTRLGRSVALKFVKAQFSERFEREARAIAALNHPHIATLYDVGEHEGAPYLAMEFVEGQPLKGPRPVKEVIEYGIQIADALAAAHAAGIVHRDLKPANILVTEKGSVKILDFGLAKLRAQAGDATPATTTLTGVSAGTPGYMSPEQIDGKPVDSRSDIFAFGCVLYELASGRHAFEGNSVGSVLAATVTSEPKPLDRVPSELNKLIRRCLRKELDRRFQNMSDVRVALVELKAESESGQRAAAAPAPSRKTRRWLWAAGFAALAVLAAFALYRWLAPRPVPFARWEISRLTDTRKASAAAISPDGKSVVHAVTENGDSSLWWRNTDTGSNLQILPPARGTFNNLRFSRDGNSLYYVFGTGATPPALYTMPVPGGPAGKLTDLRGIAGESLSPDEARVALRGIAGASLSPDQKRLAFTGHLGPDRFLFIANIDGSGVRQLASRKFPEAFSAPDWSPDGKTIAYEVHSYKGGISLRLAAMSAEGGPEKRIGSRTWYRMSDLRWMPDGHGLMTLASEQPGGFADQVWYVSYPEGDARRITNDLNRYSGLSLTGDSSALVTVQIETTSSILVVPSGDPASAREITGRLHTPGAFLDWIGNGNIVFNAPDSKQQQRLWIAAADGTSQRQLTTEGLRDEPLGACGDGSGIVFNSYRTGSPQIWRSDLDGGNARQLTHGEGEFGPSCSPDGKWLTYGSLDPKRFGVWRMPIDDAPPERIWNEYGWTYISPDGKSVLVREFNAAEPKIRIIPANGGPPVRSFDIPERGRMRWSADSKSLLFVKTSGGVSNVWRQPLGGGAPSQVTSFTERSDLRRRRVARRQEAGRVAVFHLQRRRNDSRSEVS